MNRNEWRNQIVEPAIEPDMPVIDTHHHIWTTSPAEPWEPYGPDEVVADVVNGGHNVVATVYVDSHANYRTTGPEHLRPVGETEYVEALAQKCAARSDAGAGVCAGIVSHADLLLGSAVGEVLDAHMAMSGRFRGIRHMTAFDPDLPPVYGATEPGIMPRAEFREGFAELVKRGLSFDAWMFQAQLPELTDLAKAFPDANIILDHVGGPLAIGRYANRRDEAFGEWKKNIGELARLPNITVKLGGLNMAITGMDAVEKSRPHSSQETADLQRDHILTTIDLFGPDRCMFETNFPVDMRSISYNLVWNSFKRLTADMAPAEREKLFNGTARRVYRLD